MLLSSRHAKDNQVGDYQRLLMEESKRSETLIHFFIRSVSSTKQPAETSPSNDDTPNAFPCLVTLNSGIRIASVAAGGRHTLALSDSGMVWGWGYGGEGQLGLGSRLRIVSSPQLVPCIDSSSYVMAAELVRAAQSESEDKPERLRFYYYAAGTGGAGPTILATSFLLLGEEVVAYNKGEKIKLKPYSGMLNVDFGKGIGKRDVYLLNLPEVRSAHEILGVPTVSARFGTAPFFWNWGMEAMTYLFPPEFLRDRSKVGRLVELFDPVVRAVDGIAGERVSMRVELECSSGRNTVGIFSHRRLSVSVGVATAAFALAILEGSTQPGVWFPEEPQGIPIEAREVLLKRASQGTINFLMNRSPWMIETNPKELGLGIYV